MGMLVDYTLAMAALEAARPHLSEDESDALGRIISLFAPYAGDDPNKARARTATIGHCRNCGLERPVFFHPAPLERVALAGMRLAQCPRCFSTTIMIGRGKAEDRTDG